MSSQTMWIVMAILVFLLMAVTVMIFGGFKNKTKKHHHHRHSSTGSSSSGSSSSSTTTTGTSDFPPVTTMPEDDLVVLSSPVPGPLSASDAELTTVAAAAGGKIPGSYIIVFHPAAYARQRLASASTVVVAAEAQGLSQHALRGTAANLLQSILGHPGVGVAALGTQEIRPMHHYDDVLKGASVKNVSAQALAQLRRHPSILAIHEDTIVGLGPIERKLIEPRDVQAQAGSQVIPWGINRIGGPQSSTRAGNSSGIVPVDVYIIDTGRAVHPDVSVVSAANFVTSGTSTSNDLNGHGTHVSGTASALDNTFGVVGGAPGSRVRSVRVLDQNGNGSFSDVIAGVNYVAAQKRARPSFPAVANMSLGAYVGTTDLNALDLAVRDAISAGVVFTIAAGNSGGDASLYTPAHVPEAITVAAYDSNNNMAGFSNWGSFVTIQAPGVSVISTWLNRIYASLSGTSMASPHVAGACALYLSRHPSATPAQVKAAIIAAGAPSGSNPAINVSRPNTTTRSLYIASF
jgi:hypothetical protein